MKDKYRGCLIGGAVGEVMARRNLQRVLEGVREPGAVAQDTHPLGETRISLLTANALLVAETRLNNYGIASVKQAVRDCFDGYENSSDDMSQYASESWLCEPSVFRYLSGEVKSIVNNCPNIGKRYGCWFYAVPIGLMYDDNVIFDIAKEISAAGSFATTNSLAGCFMAQIVHDIIKLPEKDLAQIVAKALKKLNGKYRESDECRSISYFIERILAIHASGSDEDADLFSRELTTENKAFAWAIFCCLKYHDNFCAALYAALQCGIEGVAVAVGALMGATLGMEGIPECCLSDLPFQSTILEIADDLCEDSFQLSEGSMSCSDGEIWLQKYRMSCETERKENILC